MNHVLADFVGKFVMVFFNDICVFSRSQAEHEEHLHLVFQGLEEHNLTVKPSKYFFNKLEIRLLGYMVSGKGIKSVPEKVEAFQQMAPPDTVRGVRSRITF